MGRGTSDCCIFKSNHKKTADMFQSDFVAGLKIQKTWRKLGQACLGPNGHASFAADLVLSMIMSMIMQLVQDCDTKIFLQQQKAPWQSEVPEFQ